MPNFLNRELLNEVFERLNLKLLQDEVSKNAMRGVGMNKTNAGLGAADWQGTFLVLETLAATGSLDPKSSKERIGNKSTTGKRGARGRVGLNSEH
jgi:hypothetical protein